MIARALLRAPEPALRDALAQFERTFVYPLGENRSFRISHGEDYSRFYRAISGDSGASFIAIVKGGTVRGTLGVAVRPLRFPDGECRLAAYLGDLKISPGAGRGWTLLRLGAEVTAWSKAKGAVVAYGVVMDGTKTLPTAYTGKLGIHPFRQVHRLCILRVPVSEAGQRRPDPAFVGQLPLVAECFEQLSAGAFVPLGGSPELRSSFSAIPLVSPDHTACGILEDTRLAKRLIEQDGREMYAAHLSRFAYTDPSAGVLLLREALARCASATLAPALFVAVPAGDVPGFLALLTDLPGIVQANATVYGTWPDLVSDRWQISTSEI
jgi:hypothetical protein